MAPQVIDRIEFGTGRRQPAERDPQAVRKLPTRSSSMRRTTVKEQHNPPPPPAPADLTQICLKVILVPFLGIVQLDSALQAQCAIQHALVAVARDRNRQRFADLAPRGAQRWCLGDDDLITKQYDRARATLQMALQPPFCWRQVLDLRAST